MAETFHFSISMISRGKSKSAVASAAYISCEKIKNEWDGEVHDYHNKKGLLHSEIFLPENVPIALKDRTTLWNSVELNEKASNAQLARNFIIALPKELSFEENKKLITEFIQKNFVSKGMIADLAIHDESDEENNNIHAHIMTTLRPINEKGEWQAKSKKEYVLDENGEKVKLKNGNYKTRKVELTDWNDKGNAEKWRENFASLCNQYLEKNHQEKRVDHRSYKRQGIEEIPTIHLGASASALERKGIETDKGNINREIKKHNSLVKAIREKIAELTSWINDFSKALFENGTGEAYFEKTGSTKIFFPAICIKSEECPNHTIRSSLGSKVFKSVFTLGKAILGTVPSGSFSKANSKSLFIGVFLVSVNSSVFSLFLNSPSI